MSKEIIGRGQPSVSTSERQVALQKLKERQREWKLMRQQLASGERVPQFSRETAFTTPYTSPDLRAGRK